FILPRPPTPTLFPSTTLFRSALPQAAGHGPHQSGGAQAEPRRKQVDRDAGHGAGGHALAHVYADLLQSLWVEQIHAPALALQGQDRKSTRLNSSHVKISYAVF